MTPRMSADRDYHPPWTVAAVCRSSMKPRMNADWDRHGSASTALDIVRGVAPKVLPPSLEVRTSPRRAEAAFRPSASDDAAHQCGLRRRCFGPVVAEVHSRRPGGARATLCRRPARARMARRLLVERRRRHGAFSFFGGGPRQPSAAIPTPTTRDSPDARRSAATEQGAAGQKGAPE